MPENSNPKRTEIVRLYERVTKKGRVRFYMQYHLNGNIKKAIMKIPLVDKEDEKKYQKAKNKAEAIVRKETAKIIKIRERRLAARKKARRAKIKPKPKPKPKPRKQQIAITSDTELMAILHEIEREEFRGVKLLDMSTTPWVAKSIPLIGIIGKQIALRRGGPKKHINWCELSKLFGHPTKKLVDSYRKAESIGGASNVMNVFSKHKKKGSLHKQPSIDNGN